METNLVVTDETQAVGLAGLMQSARSYIAQSKANNTLRAYSSDWTAFTTWCKSHSVTSLPASPETVALYIASSADSGLKVATIGRRLASISKAHQAAEFESPAAMRHAAVSEVWKGIKRAKGTGQTAKAPVLTADVRAMVNTLEDSLLGTRDRALLLIGFAGAFRRSELVNLIRANVEFNRDGLVVTLRRSKTDQEGEGRKIGLPFGSNPSTCPIRALQAWLEASGITEGPLFRSVTRHGKLCAALTAQSVALVVKARAGAAGLDPAKYSGHSLRAGLATSAAINGVSERSIMNQTGHKSAAMVRRYIRDGSLFRENAAAGVGL